MVGSLAMALAVALAVMVDAQGVVSLSRRDVFLSEAREGQKSSSHVVVGNETAGQRPAPGDS